MATVVNKGTLADILGCSIPHVDELMKRYPAFPVLKRGERGVGWEFEAETVRDFLAARRAEEEEAAAAARAKIDGLKLPGLLEDSKSPVSAHEELSLLRGEQIKRKLAMEAGMLISTAEMRAALNEILYGLQTALRALPSQIRRKHALPEDVERSIAATIDDMLRGTVASLKMRLRGADDEQVELRA